MPEIYVPDEGIRVEEIEDDPIVIDIDALSQGKGRTRGLYCDGEMLAFAKTWAHVAEKPKMFRGYSFWKNVSEYLHSEYKYECCDEVLRVMWACMSKDCKL